MPAQTPRNPRAHSFSLMTLFKTIAAAGLLLGLAGCSGGGGSAATTTATSATAYTVGGTVTGLTGSVVLQDNGGDNLTVAANGAFTFASKVTNNGAYKVTVLTQPTGQTCSVSTGAGTVSGSNVSNVAVVCAINTYNVGGTVSGLTGSVVLQDNNGDNLTVATNGVFTFATKVANGSPYSVTVLTQPTGQNCSVASGTGTIAAANVANVAITCATNTYTVGGNVSLLNGSMVLQDNGADNTTVAVNGPFNFPTAVAYGNPYNVSVLSQPLNQRCFVANGAGSVTANVTNVAVSCASQLGGAMQGIPLNLVPTVSTLAGSVSNLDGTGTAARFNLPNDTTSDGTNLYVADASSNEIRKIVIATGVVTTLAGSGVAGAADGTGAAATFNHPVGITTDGTNLYVADMNNHKIRKIVIATGVVSSLTGVANNWGAPGAADGAGTAATFNYPDGITTDNTNLYVADTYNHKIRQIVIATGVVSSLTGVANTAMAAGAIDGAGTAATFNYPDGITTDNTNLYVADSANNKIRKIVIATGVVSSVTGVASTAGMQGAADGAGTTATFFFLRGITTDGTNLYVADLYNNKIRQIVIATGVVSSLTGVANTAATTGAADGAGTTATFNYPVGITTVGANLYVADSANNKIRKIVISTGVVTTLAGTLPWVDGTGAAATFNYPAGITTDGANLYVADSANNKIRKIVIATGVVTTLAGSGVADALDGTGTTATFNYPTDITTDGANLYVADRGNKKIRKIVIATGVVSSLTGVANTAMASGAIDGAGTVATFNMPFGITTDNANLYVADFYNNKIRKIVIATGVVSSLTGVANTAMAAGVIDGAGTAATFNYPIRITTDGTNLYVADLYNNKIRKIVIATGVVSSVTGAANTAGAYGAVDGAGTAAKFNYPNVIATDGTNLYVADSGNNKIRKIVIATGVVSSVTGVANTASVPGAVDGAGAVATFAGPAGITTDGRSLYVSDAQRNTIRNIQ